MRHADGLPPAILEAVRGADLVVHCGDFTGAALPQELRSLARQFVGVLGNSDVAPLREALPRREVLRLHGLVIGVCHPYWGGFPDGIADDILRRDFGDLRLDALLFGHTHEGLVERRPYPATLTPSGAAHETPSPSGRGQGAGESREGAALSGGGSGGVPHLQTPPSRKGRGPGGWFARPLGDPASEMGTILLVNPGPGYADFMQPASFARLRVSPAGIEAELVVLE